MDDLFLQVLEMSVDASWLVLAVAALRLILKRAPKAIHCILWGMVALRLIIPAMPQSAVSLIPDSKQVSQAVQIPQTDAVVILPPSTQPDTALPEHIPTEPVAEEEQWHWRFILPGVWIVGVGMMLGYGLVSYLLLRRKVAASIREGDVWLCDDVVSPFILGIIRPRIYLPSKLEEAYRSSVLAHERAHLQRKDHWWKPMGFVLLSIHWFNPVMWFGYILLCRDIEAACDERVVKKMDMDARKAYSEALLSCAASRRSIAACPLAFGEQGVKGRIKTVLNYKKPAFWIVLAAIVALVSVAVCFLTNPEDKADSPDTPTEPTTESTAPEQSVGHELLKTEDMLVLYQKVPGYFITIGKGTEVYVWEQEGALYCGAMAGTNRYKTDEEIQSLIGISLESMAMILDTYTIPDWDISVIPVGGSSHWPKNPAESDFQYIKSLRDRLGLYTVEQGDATISLSEISFIDRTNGYFLADGGDGIYKVYCSDMTGLDIGYNVGVVYNERRESPGTAFDYEITAVQYHVTKKIDRQVIFELFEEPAIEGERFTKPVTRYIADVTYEEYTALQAMMKPTNWYDPIKMNRQFVYTGLITVQEHWITPPESSYIAFESETMYLGNGFLNNGYAVGCITDEQQTLIQELIRRARKLEFVQDGLSGQYTASEYRDWSIPWISFSGDTVSYRSPSSSGYISVGRVAYEGDRVTVTLDKGGTMVFEIVGRTLIYDGEASDQQVIEMEDGTVLYKQI